MIDFHRHAKPPFVRVTADDGTTRDWPWDQFFADEAGCVAQTGNGINPPVIEPDPSEKLAALEKENIALREALIAKGVITKAEIDAKAVEAVALEVALEVAKP